MRPHCRLSTIRAGQPSGLALCMGTVGRRIPYFWAIAFAWAFFSKSKVCLLTVRYDPVEAIRAPFLVGLRFRFAEQNPQRNSCLPMQLHTYLKPRTQAESVDLALSPRSWGPFDVTRHIIVCHALRKTTARAYNINRRSPSLVSMNME